MKDIVSIYSTISVFNYSGVRARDMNVRNSYLVCRMFWCDESVHSAVCWGTSEPQFKFQQVNMCPSPMKYCMLEYVRKNLIFFFFFFFFFFFLNLLPCTFKVLINEELSRLMGKSTMWFLNRSDSNRPVRSEKQARSLKFWI